LNAYVLLAAVLLLSSSPAWALGGSGPVVVDIVGSIADNTHIMATGMEKVDLEIIGSETNNTTIGSPQEKDCRRDHREERRQEEDGFEDKGEGQGQGKVNPWDGMHLGVDAWYDTFWYMDDINMPKWPQF